MTTTTDIPGKLLESLAELAAARARQSAAIDAIAELHRFHAPVYDERSAADAAVRAAEAATRSLIADAFAETGEKRINRWCGVRVRSRPVYDETEALAWAKRHDIALKLDRTEFERVAAITAPRFVTFEDEVTTTIATDLSGLVTS